MGARSIGARNVFYPFCSVGVAPQDLKYGGEPTETEIGDDNTIRESVTISRGTVKGGGITRVGSKNLLMTYVHIGHDSLVGSNCILANAATLAGHVTIEDYASVGAFCPVHQFCTVGKYCVHRRRNDCDAGRAAVFTDFCAAREQGVRHKQDRSGAARLLARSGLRRCRRPSATCSRPS